MHNYRTANLLLATTLLTLLVSSCAPLQSERLRASAVAFPDPIELDTVPYFPPQGYPSAQALAIVLNYSGVTMMPEQLTPISPSPQIESERQSVLLTDARRFNRVPYVLRPQLESIAAEVASGNPVMVLQNLGRESAPIWHYAVAFGFDLPKGEIVLRSTERRQSMALSDFELSWRLGNYWAMVVLPPEHLPFTAEEILYLQSVMALEHEGMIETAAQAYAAALKRWPQSLVALMGLGNTRYVSGDLAGAEKAFRLATQHHPSSAPTHQALAQTLADQRRYDEAEAVARRALELEASEPLHSSMQQTLDDIVKARAAY